jgi:hypothetical protein
MFEIKKVPALSEMVPFSILEESFLTDKKTVANSTGWLFLSITLPLMLPVSCA